MIPSVSVGWSPDVTAIYTAASYILHKVGLYTWEPYRAQPTKRALLAANFIPLLLTQGFAFPDQMSPKINVICILLLWRVLHTHQNNTGINTWKPVLSISHLWSWANSHSHMTERKPRALFSPLLLTGGNLKIKAAALLWTRFDCGRSIWEHQYALHSWHRALLTESTVWHRMFGRCRSSDTTAQAARSPRISAQFWGCKSTLIVKNSTLQGIVNFSPFKKWPLQRVPHF